MTTPCELLSFVRLPAPRRQVSRPNRHALTPAGRNHPMVDEVNHCTGCSRDVRECSVMPCLVAENLLAEPGNEKELEALWPGTTIEPKQP